VLHRESEDDSGRLAKDGYSIKNKKVLVQMKPGRANSKELIELYKGWQLAIMIARKEVFLVHKRIQDTFTSLAKKRKLYSIPLSDLVYGGLIYSC